MMHRGRIHRRARRAGRATLLLLAAVCSARCAARDHTHPLILASTTSTEDSGLFDVLLPAFEAAHPDQRVKLIAVGSGEALALGRRGDADVLLVHAPAAEDAYMADGHGVLRRAVMHNDFIIVGPAEDPARVAEAESAADAIRRIERAGASFISRGDDSGTHKKELGLWKAAGSSPDTAAARYAVIGQGMGEALAIASERRAYTLSDRGTYLFLRDGLALKILHEGDPILFNPYSVITVRGARNPAGAELFAGWIVGDDAQRLIGTYGVGRFGRSLFVPDARDSTR